MSDIESIESVELERGPAAIKLIPPTTVTENQRLVDSIANEYRVYFDDEAAGGCIMYGLYDRGWIVNPSARWPLQELTRLVLEFLRAAGPFVRAFESVRACHEPEINHQSPKQMQAFLDENMRIPSGTTIGDCRRLADSVSGLSTISSALESHEEPVWIGMPAENEICEVFVGGGLGFTDHAVYSEGAWYSYSDLEKSTPLNVIRWKRG